MQRFFSNIKLSFKIKLLALSNLHCYLDKQGIMLDNSFGQFVKFDGCCHRLLEINQLS